ncbi:MAG: hypothetical protein B7Z73_05370 [Planctomycetia bacterium 21-64-5]|nr:MAG: hypothetical protein B7Z73_05370 [Planctomycetia bacterium 21-64-5]HQU43939.1 DUF1080 domain-containing protein [Pirellulales bacterium]
MKLLLSFAIACLLLPGSSAAAAGDETGWLSLFDGKSLAGWHKNPDKIGHGTGGSWMVEDGAIVGQQDPPGSGNGGILLTDRKFGDFELVIEMKPDWGVDSGLFLRSNDKGQCFQMMVDYHEDGDVGHIYGEGTGGFNNRPFRLVAHYDDLQRLVRLTTRPVDGPVPAGYSVSGEGWLQAWKIGGWNTARMVCVGQPPTIRTWINGVKISEFNGQTCTAANYDRQKVADLLGPEVLEVIIRHTVQNIQLVIRQHDAVVAGLGGAGQQGFGLGQVLVDLQVGHQIDPAVLQGRSGKHRGCQPDGQGQRNGKRWIVH